jgi:hypothetical protein
MYLSIIYVHSSSFARNKYFCGLCKQEKNDLLKSFICSIEFSPFYTRHKASQFFMKRLYERVAREDVRANFSVDLFKISKYM